MKTISLTMAVWALTAAASYGQGEAVDAASPLTAYLLRADVGGSVDDPIIYIPKGGTTTRWSFFKVRYRGELPTEGFFNVDGEPVRMKITSSNPELLRIYLLGDKTPSTGLVVDSRLGERYEFLKPGEVTITITVGEESRGMAIKIVEVPIKDRPLGTPSADVIETLGLPDKKREVFVSWPHFETIDGIIYNPPAGNAAMAEHWRYNAYPGLVVSIMNGRVRQIASNTSTAAIAEAIAEATRKEAEAAREAAQKAARDALFRNWTDSAGKFSLLAKFIELKSSQVYLERKDDGQTIKVPMSRLSTEDQEWIRNELNRQKEEERKAAAKKAAARKAAAKKAADKKRQSKKGRR